MEALHLTDLMDIDKLQKIQDSLSNLTGMPLFICDADGKAVTSASGCSCPAWSTEYTAPIIVGGQMLGSIASGPSAHKKDASSIHSFLTDTADIISGIIETKYHAIEANRAAEQAVSSKSDFLANMSHEIRTPMNAVIGMAEMALRQELTPEARNYITQIRTSGKALLNIINDILDFSKIDSGKMDIIPEEYEPAAMLHDVASIASTRLRDKDVELLVSLNPTFPVQLYGDDLRIRQILINLVNNAIKFTNKGHVDMIVDYEMLDADHILMKVDIRDTGIGIKDSDLSRLFHSFQQVDSKRNRNIEGTGLGLAISKQLLSLMGGSINVTSTYGKGSTFSFTLPQRIVDPAPAIKVHNADSLIAIGYLKNKYFARQFFTDTQRMGVYSAALTAPDRFESLLYNYRKEIVGRQLYFFIEERSYNDNLELIIRMHPEVHAVMLTEYFSDTQTDLPNLTIIKKPFSTMQIAMALNNEEFTFHNGEEMFEFDFTAPSAHILVVDDNPVNLVVTEGLLKPLNMNITCADSGKKALKLIPKQHFDLILMDHMMPELDGIETTRIIRRLHPSYDTVPIIALTANAMDGSRELFLSEGMNDFIPKPIELKDISSKIKKWLPQDKICKTGQLQTAGHTRLGSDFQNTDQQKASSCQTDVSVIGDLDTAYARKLLDSDELYIIVLQNYYNTIPKKTQSIREHVKKQEWDAYAIEVHALKGISRQIGAHALADMAALLEQAGKSQDIRTITAQTEKMLAKYNSYLEILKPFCKENPAEATGDLSTPPDVSFLPTQFDLIREAIDNLDMDQMDEILSQMQHYTYPPEQNECFDRLKTAATDMDFDRCAEIVESWKELI